ncbi:hypothetical protein CXB51_001253 [Gossypium anomalum]|uniref:Endonuclease/exonuclease/phosphatase domain-containing protein n=1 Tax=Gossypium anomalum TaxID=47600 RepID=A0A8J5ZRN7_9ROSI|nr:hypothetical protein CXB51_001253 [Gossypium anomalum]
MDLKEKEKTKGGVEDSDRFQPLKSAIQGICMKKEEETERKLMDYISPGKAVAIRTMKLLCWNFHGLENPTVVLDLKQLLVANDPDWGLAMLWKEETKVDIQNYSKYYIDSVIKLEDQRQSGGTVNKMWIVGGDFNAVANNAEKEGGHKKSKALMDDFCNVVEELSLVDIKTVRGWYTWVNNREGSIIEKECLDRFKISANDVANSPYIATKVVHQSTLDHDSITLDTMGGKLRESDRYQGQLQI